MKRGTKLFLLTILCLFAFSFIGCSKRDGGVSVMIEHVRVRESMPIITVNGNLLPADKTDVTLSYDVPVAETFINVGSQVAQGDTLFRLNEDQITSDLNDVKFKKKEFEATIEKNTNLLRGREKMLEEEKVDPDEVLRLEKQIARDQADLERVKELVNKLTYNLEHATVVSPTAGVVTKSNVNAGSIAVGGTVLISITKINPIVFSFVIASKRSDELQINAPVSVLVHDRPDKNFVGKIYYISPEMDPAKKGFEVLVSIPNDDYSLKAGMMASTEIKSESIEKTFIVPSSAVLSISSRPYVYKVTKGIAHKIPVTISAQEGGDIEVIKGIEDGDMVVVKGGESLFDGASVNIFER